MIASYIDHTLLAPDASASAIETLCEEAKTYHFATVCVAPYRVRQAAQALAGSGVGVTTVVGFPHGANGGPMKAAEASWALAQGATEIDMVQNIGAVKDGAWDMVAKEIRQVRAAIGDITLKVILETALLTPTEIVNACKLAQEVGADFVKTSTGFAGAGATVANVKLMRDTVGPHFGVKAAGGIRDLATARAMLDAGANRLGVSAGVAIVRAENAERK